MSKIFVKIQILFIFFQKQNLKIIFEIEKLHAIHKRM